MEWLLKYDVIIIGWGKAGKKKEKTFSADGKTVAVIERDEKMAGTIVKLLNNSAVVEIYWEKSSEKMKDIMETKTIVNFKDIVEFVHK